MIYLVFGILSTLCLTLTDSYQLINPLWKLSKHQLIQKIKILEQECYRPVRPLPSHVSMATAMHPGSLQLQASTRVLPSQSSTTQPVRPLPSHVSMATAMHPGSLQLQASTRVLPSQSSTRVLPSQVSTRVLPSQASTRPSLLTTAKPVRLPFTFVTATASGDPHVDTFDGLHHDVMVSGWFVMAKNPVVTVHAYSQLGCMPPTIRNTCIRSVMVKISPSDGSNLVLSWGSWPPSGKKGDQNVVIRDSFGKHIDKPFSLYKTDVFLGGKYRVANANGNIILSPIGETVSDPELAIYITIGTYLLAVTLPKSTPHLQSTNGLLGFFNGNTKKYGKVFRNSDGSSSIKKNEMKWALSHAVVTNQSTVSPKPVVHPGRMPVITIQKINFCKKMLLHLYRNQPIKIQQHFKTQMKACLQDADSPSVARSIEKAIRVSRLQQQLSIKALKQKIEKDNAKDTARNEEDDDDL
jgi:hypothetical protein